MGAQSGPGGKVYQPTKAEMASIERDARAVGMDAYALLCIVREAASRSEAQEAALAEIRDLGT